MKKTENQHPPRWLDRLFAWYCRPELLEDLQGDLHEYYARNLERGRFRANLIFFLDVLKFFRLYTVQKPKLIRQMTFFNLTGNYFKTSIRSIARNKLFSMINVVGLAISMSVGILMITYISELLSYDSFHEKKDRIFRVTTTWQDITMDEPWQVVSTSAFIGEDLMNNYAGLEDVLIMRRGFNMDISKGENTIEVNHLISSASFFNLFSFSLESGEPTSALEEPYSMVITEKTSDKLFKDENPVGKIVSVKDKDYTITGVIEDMPKNSHLQFDALVSFSTLLEEAKNEENSMLMRWGSVWNNYVYLLLPDANADQNVQSYLDQVAESQNSQNERYDIFFTLQNLKAIVPGKDWSNQIGPSFDWDMIYKLGVLTLIVLLSACFNYTNLSIARSLRRSKEVGIRKVIGASRGQVFTQFIFEAILISSLSLFFAYGLFLLIKGEFVKSILEQDMVLDFKPEQLAYFILFVLVIGFISGVLPSLVLSKLKAISIFRDTTKLKVMRGLSLRRVLIVFQFTLSIALIIGATISYRQFMFSMNFDLGFNTDNVLNLQLKDNDSDLLINELAKKSGVQSISRSSMIPSIGDVWSERFKYKDPMDSASLMVNHVDRNYAAIHDFNFLAGGSFPYDLKEDQEPRFIIIDELVLDRFNIGKPEEAIGQVLKQTDKPDLEIIGVIESFQYLTINDQKDPVVLMQGEKDEFNHINILVNSNYPIELINRLEEAWKKVDPVHPFEASFYDEKIEEAYSEFQAMFKVFGFLAVIAISIASMGLLGMAVFTTETRIKEISIRKVMGATERHLVYLLSKGFLFMLVFASLIAMPLAYFIFTKFILEDNVNRITIGPGELLSGVVLILAIGLIMISWQTFKAARTNPAEMLRNE